MALIVPEVLLCHFKYNAVFVKKLRSAYKHKTLLYSRNCYMLCTVDPLTFPTETLAIPWYSNCFPFAKEHLVSSNPPKTHVSTEAQRDRWPSQNHTAWQWGRQDLDSSLMSSDTALNHLESEGNVESCSHYSWNYALAVSPWNGMPPVTCRVSPWRMNGQCNSSYWRDCVC